jgi:hypothetical protein
MIYLINIFRYLVAIPLEAIRYPFIFCLKIALVYFSVAAIVLAIFAYGYSSELLYKKAIIMAGISAIAGSTIPLYFFILKSISPFYGWLERRTEKKYFDKEYRLDIYKNNRRFAETGFNKMDAEETTYHAIQNLTKKHKNE